MSEKSGVQLPGRACNFLLMSCERLEQVIREAGLIPSRGATRRWKSSPSLLAQGTQLYGGYLYGEAELKPGIRVFSLSQDLLVDLDPRLL